MIISDKTATIVQELLAHHGIHHYVIEAIPEGKELPGSTYPGEVTSMSGAIITPTNVYDFLFDWHDGKYTLGEDDGSWKTMNDEDLGKEAMIIHAIQSKLREANPLQ